MGLICRHYALKGEIPISFARNSKRMVRIKKTHTGHVNTAFVLPDEFWAFQPKCSLNAKLWR